MTRFFFLLLTCFFGCNNSYAEIPQKFYGDWKVHVIKQAGFPWWNQIKYPTELNISSERVIFADQYEYKCEVSKITYDEVLDSLVFEHCGIGNKNNNAFSIVHVVMINDKGNIEGTVQNYKKLFAWVGEKK